MIVDERMTAFINSLDTGNTPFLTELEVKALEDHVPIIRREMQSFLKVLLQMQRPVNILEVGTAVGFSTLLFCEYAPKEAKITRIEKYEKYSEDTSGSGKHRCAHKPTGSSPFV